MSMIRANLSSFIAFTSSLMHHPRRSIDLPAKEEGGIREPRELVQKLPGTQKTTHKNISTLVAKTKKKEKKSSIPTSPHQIPLATKREPSTTTFRPPDPNKKKRVNGLVVKFSVAIRNRFGEPWVRFPVHASTDICSVFLFLCSVIGLVVKFSVAIGEPWVRFPDYAL
ncbi:hypothetical protein V8C44DRAFT_5824 [Trichoderma aethiopicum]